MPSSDIFKGKNGSLSSKRIIGTICIGFSILLVSVTFILSGIDDIPPNVQVVSLQFLITGAAMISAGTFETKN